ncbi:hypothetical protein HanHA89_Chr01g0002571 [Helianthus annuus]|nr:hypothetical protein HanHA89_Chr01g0002571 [Helianthus annuus]
MGSTTTTDLRSGFDSGVFVVQPPPPVSNLSLSTGRRWRWWRRRGGEMVEVVAEMWWFRFGGFGWCLFCGGACGGGGGGDVVVEVVAEICGSGGDAGLWAGEEVRRLKAMSAWGRGEADVYGLQIFRKTNKLQSSNICARLRGADISGQKYF